MPCMYSVNSSSARDLHVNIPDAVCIMERLRARISFVKGCIYRQKYIINFSKQAVDAVYHTQQHHWVARIAPCYVCEFMLPSNVYGLLYRVTQIFHCIQILLLLHWCVVIQTTTTALGIALEELHSSSQYVWSLAIIIWYQAQSQPAPCV